MDLMLLAPAAGAAIGSGLLSRGFTPAALTPDAGRLLIGALALSAPVVVAALGLGDWFGVQFGDRAHAVAVFGVVAAALVVVGMADGAAFSAGLVVSSAVPAAVAAAGAAVASYAVAQVAQ